MHRLNLKAGLLILFVFTLFSFAQNGMKITGEKPQPPKPQPVEQKPAPELAQRADAQSPPLKCLIVKHKGTLGRRLLWTALIGVPIAPGSKYDYVDSVNYRNTKMTYKGGELETLQAADVHVILLDSKYKAEDLNSARDSCKPAAVAVK